MNVVHNNDFVVNLLYFNLVPYGYSSNIRSSVVICWRTYLHIYFLWHKQQHYKPEPSLNMKRCAHTWRDPQALRFKPTPTKKWTQSYPTHIAAYDSSSHMSTQTDIKTGTTDRAGSGNEKLKHKEDFSCRQRWTTTSQYTHYHCNRQTEKAVGWPCLFLPIYAKLSYIMLFTTKNVRG